MTGPAALDQEGVVARLDELERQNAELRRAAIHGERPRGGWWRAVASALVIAVAALLVPVSVVGAWARVQLIDEESFVGMLAPLVDEPSVQELIVDETMTAVRARIDFEVLTDAVFDGVVVPVTDERTAEMLGLLRQPAADGLDSLVSTSVQSAVESAAFARIWEMALRGGHRALTAVSTSDGGGIVVLTDQGVGIRLGPLVDGVKAELADRGIGIATIVPTIDRTIIVGGAENVIAIRTGYALADAIGWWLPIITTLLFLAGLMLARRRSAALTGIGVALALGGGSLAVALEFGRIAIGAAAGESGIPPAAIGAVYAHVIADLSATGTAVAVFGLILAVVGWLTGASRPARRVRSATGVAYQSARRALQRRSAQAPDVVEVPT
ncbi:hypothetical protein ACFC14_02395 [Microbacterium sp. NPDC055988]|uniref:hypothetical protein n=1 Tax=Microbacterium sp. NPDC055988 TaxID=3345671 RepID=UPI0035D8D807